MPRDFSQIGTYLLVVLILFAVYRRLRRSFGRQKLQPVRTGLRILLLAVVGVLLAPMTLRSPAFAVAAMSGLAGGILLAFWGASRTTFERVGAELVYRPHTYTGVAVSLLFIGRVAFRLLDANRAGPRLGAADYVSSPLTLGLFFVLVGYYVCYSGWILWKSKHLKGGDAMVTPSPLGAGPGAPS